MQQLRQKRDMEFVQVNLTTPYLFFIVPSTRVSPKPEKLNCYTKSLISYLISPIIPIILITPIKKKESNSTLLSFLVILNFES